MLIVKSLEPGTYRVICIPIYYTPSAGFYGGQINTLLIVPVEDGVPAYERPLHIVEDFFDDDLDRSSIVTRAGFAGDHDVQHHKFESYGIIDTAKDGSNGYSRENKDSHSDYLRTSYKSIVDYRGGSWTSSNSSSIRYFSASRGGGTTRYREENVNKRTGKSNVTEVSNEVILGSDSFSVTYHYFYKSSTGSISTKQGTVDLPYSRISNGWYLDFTVGYHPVDVASYFRRWKILFEHLGELSAKEPKPDSFGACLQAALDFNSYDINMIEALAGFSGINDLVPVDLASDISKELAEFCKSPSLLTSLAKAAYVSATSYLYGKYVFENNVADVESLLGLSGSKRFAEASEIARKIHAALSPNEEAEWNFRLAKMARKIVYKYDFLQDSYGTKVLRASSGYDSVTVTSRAHLQATPGPMRDMSAVAIICDDIGLSLRASRIAQAVKFEFIANWFLPIEDTLDRIEFNHIHLSQLYRVKKLCQSTKIIHSYNVMELAPLFGLAELEDGNITITSYTRFTSDKFPPTTFQQRSSDGLSKGRLLQGTALLITAAAR